MGGRQATRCASATGQIASPPFPDALVRRWPLLAWGYRCGSPGARFSRISPSGWLLRDRLGARLCARVSGSGPASRARVAEAPVHGSVGTPQAYSQERRPARPPGGDRRPAAPPGPAHPPARTSPNVTAPASALPHATATISRRGPLRVPGGQPRPRAPRLLGRRSRPAAPSRRSRGSFGPGARPARLGSSLWRARSHSWAAFTTARARVISSSRAAAFAVRASR